MSALSVQNNAGGIAALIIYLIISSIIYINNTPAKELFEINVPSLIYIICTAIVFFLLAMCGCFSNKITVEVTQDEIKTFSFASKKTHAVPRNDIKQLFCRKKSEKKQIKNSSYMTYTYSVYFIDSSDQHHELLGGLSSPYLARYIEQEAENLLKIDDEPVKDELDYSQKLQIQKMAECGTQAQESSTPKSSD